jgi:hypothetical protein
MKQTTRDNLIYLGVGLTVAGAGVFYAFYTDRTLGRTPVPSVGTLWGIFSTPIVAALLLEGYWRYRRRPMLWVILAAVAAVNVSVVLVARREGWNPPVLAWSLATGFLMIPLFVITAKLLGGGPAGPAGRLGRNRPTSAHPRELRGKHRE